MWCIAARACRGAILGLIAGGWMRAGAQIPPQPTTPRFQAVVRLAQDGYADSARSVVARILARTATNDPSYAEALFTQAIVAATGDETRRDLIRIAIDYGQSAWADKALLRLAALEYGAGNDDGTLQRVTQLFTDYPTSPVLGDGALWGARAAFDKHQLQIGCTWVARGLTRTGDNIELRNQLEFAKQSCIVGQGAEIAPQVPESLRVKPPAHDSTAPDTTRHGTPPADSGRGAKPPVADTTARTAAVVPVTPVPHPDTGTHAAKPATQKAADHWRVQVAALSDSAVIHRIVAKIEAIGLRAFLLPGPRGLMRIQAGPFATRAQAVAQVARLKAAVGGAPYVTPTP